MALGYRPIPGERGDVPPVREDLPHHLRAFFGHTRLRDIAPALVRAFKARKIEEGLNPNTVGVVQGVLNVVLN